jgi:hypothetical protein
MNFKTFAFISVVLCALALAVVSGSQDVNKAAQLKEQKVREHIKYSHN